MLVASYTKSGGSWLVWMAIELLYKPDYFCDLTDKTILDELVKKTEYPISIRPDIHVFRHPLDVVCSAWNYTQLVQDEECKLTESEYYDYFLEEGALFNFIPKTQYEDSFVYGLQAPIQIGYEDMLDNPARELIKIVSYNPKAELKNVNSAVEKYTLQNCKSREHDAVNTLTRRTNPGHSFFFKARKYYYKEKLNTIQLQKGHAVFSDIIKEYWPDSI